MTKNKCCSSTSLNLRHELIDLYYDYINNYQLTKQAEQKVIARDNTIKTLKAELKRKYGFKAGMGLLSNMKLSIPLLIKPEYAYYLKEYGRPKNGIYDAEKMACIIEKYNITQTKPNTKEIEVVTVVETTEEPVPEPTLEQVTELVAEYEKIVEEIYGVNIESCYDDETETS